MKNKIYLGNIDPNNNIGNIFSFRRQLMYYLLSWDCILMSDSQFICDPRLMQLMGKFEGNNPDKHLNNVNKNQCDAEILVQSGLIQVACRKTEQKTFSLFDVWDSMSNRNSNNVPYLPTTGNYAEFLDSLSPVTSSYDLSKIANLFKKNLLRGIDDLPALELKAENKQDALIREMLQMQEVLFADLLELIRGFLKDGLISVARYEELYQYFYSCYSINIPKQTESFTSTYVQNLPLHLDCGIGDYCKPSANIVYSKLRPTWVLQPEVLDLLSFADFIEVRKNVAKHIKSGKLIRHSTGILTSDEWKDYIDLWEDYTIILEREILSALKSNQLVVMDRLMEIGYTPVQKTILADGLELTVNAFSIVPVAGSIVSNIYNGAQFVSKTKNIAVGLSNFSEEKSLQSKRKLLSNYTQKHTPIITKF